MGNSRYIAIEGPIGVGKTSLARRLADSLEGELLLEEAEANPFLERFYQDPARRVVARPAVFPFSARSSDRATAAGDMFAETRISDFLIEKDRLFAEINLDRHELGLYDKVAESLDFEPPTPDLVVYLQAPVDTLLFALRGAVSTTSSASAGVTSSGWPRPTRDSFTTTMQRRC